MRTAFSKMLMLVAVLCSSLSAEDAGKIARDADSEITVDVKIVEVRRTRLIQLGFDLSSERPRQQSPLSAREFQLKMNELMKLRDLKDLRGMTLIAIIDKESKYISGGEVTIGQETFETGTRIEIKPTRQPDDNLKLQWHVSIGEMMQPQTKLLQKKKPPFVTRREWKGDCIISHSKPVFMIPDVAPDQEWIAMLQFHVEESPKVRTTSENSVGRASSPN